MRQGLKVHHLGDLGDPEVPGDAGLCTTPQAFRSLNLSRGVLV